MANHVSNFIQVIGNDKATAEFTKVFEPLVSDQGSLFELDFMPKYQGKVGIDHVGAKWAYVEDADDDYVSVTSAWSPVLPFVEELGSYLSEFDENVKITCRFEDEAYNFVGAALYHDGEVISDDEDYENLVESRLAYLESRGDEQDEEEYDPWEDAYWHEFVDERICRIETDLLESCEEPVTSFCGAIN